MQQVFFDIFDTLVWNVKHEKSISKAKKKKNHVIWASTMCNHM